MTHPARANKKPASLSDLLNKRLGAYALTAAGVSALALIPPAAAKIVYTKTNVNVFSLSSYPLDLNGDGKADFAFVGNSFFSDCIFATSVEITPALAGNSIWWDVKGKGAAALRAGVSVGSKARFAGKLLMGSQHNYCGNTYFGGPWENGGKGVINRYLGLKFKINRKTHYGWARLNFPNPMGATLTGYAYETISNKPIITGKTKGGVEAATQPSLGQLAKGTAGLSSWRAR